MKCEKCFFCTKIGEGLVADYPVKYCKYYKTYKIPFLFSKANGGIKRRLDLSKVSDCKIWAEVGCDIHPARVEKAKRDFLKGLEGEGNG